MKHGTRLLLGLALLGALPAPARAQDVGFKVVVPAAMAGDAIKRSILADVYLRKVLRWGDGSVISPVDQSTASPVRVAFSKQVLGKPVDAMQIYWLRQMSAPGASKPPSVKNSDAEVLAFVEGKPGAVGYVSAGATLPAGVKELQVIE